MLNQGELHVLDWMAAFMRRPLLDAWMPRITFLGDHGWFWVVLAIALMLYKPWRRIGLTIGVALLLSLFVANLWLKPLVGRIRPYDVNPLAELLILAPKDFSFPSGHSQASFAAAFALFCHQKKAGAAALGLATLIAFSRLYLYVHYPSDVLCGMVIGIALGWAAYLGVEKFSKKKHTFLSEKRQ